MSSPGFTEPWREVRLGDVARVKTGSRNNQDKKSSGAYPFFVRSATVERIDSYSYDCEAILIPGEGGIGSIFHYVNGKFEVHQRVYKISDFDSGISGRYLFYYMQQFFGVHAMENSVKATVDSLRLPTFQGFTMHVPTDVEEQHAIARTLDNANQDIAALHHRLTKAKAIKQGMMQQLLPGQTRLPGFTEPWTDVRLGELAQFSKGMGLPKSSVVDGGRLPCIHYGELFTRYGAEIGVVRGRTNDARLRVRSFKWDVLMPTSDVTPRGLAKASSVMADGVILGGDILIIRPDASRLFGPFLAHLIRHGADQVLQLVRGSTVFHIYASDMKGFNIRVPAVAEQQAVCDALRDAESEIDALRVRLIKAQQIKQGMMQELLTGRTRLPVGEVVA